MAPTDRKSQRFPLRRNVGLLVGLFVILASGIAVWLSVMDRVDQLVIALVCGGVCLLASLAALWPMGKMAAAGDERVLQGAMIGMMVRLFGSLAAVAIVILLAEFPVRPAAWWTLGWYALFLAAEVWIMVSYLRPQQINANAENGAC